MPAWRGDQVFVWLHRHGVVDFAEMSDLPGAVREHLSEHATARDLELASQYSSRDGTIRLVFRTQDGEAVESVLIPDVDSRRDERRGYRSELPRHRGDESPRWSRITLCVSSQVGCRMGCRFCRTARLGLRRQLAASEIAAQMTHAAKVAQKVYGRRITNIVYMGMGEPLDNLDAVVDSIDIAMDRSALRVGARRITVSTSGLLPGIPELLRRTPVKLALSLNAADNATRSELIPSSRKYTLDDLLSTLRRLDRSDQYRLTLEYVLLDGVNDGPDDARALVRLIRGWRPTVNLIPFNPFPGAEFRRPSASRIDRFATELRRARIPVTLRRPRGDDVFAACGLLAGEGAGSVTHRETREERGQVRDGAA